jgi:hypothetical protein
MRRRWDPPRRRRKSSSAPDQGETTELMELCDRKFHLDIEADCGIDWHGTKGLEQIASMMWAKDYSILFEKEYEYNSRACGGGGYDLPPSTYRARLKGEAAESYDWRLRMHKRDEMAIALHANNMRRWSPSLLARSVSYFNLTTEFLHAEESRSRRLASRPPTMRFMRLMFACRP